MNLKLDEWDKDLPAEPEEEYQALVRSLRMIEGFNLFFVRCSPAEGERLITRVSQDIDNKQVDVLRLGKKIDSLYNIVNNLPNKDNINILFVTGIETSLLDYIKPGFGGEGNYYKMDTVPRVLGNLNLERERFRDDFSISFVFIVSLFAFKYFIHRAPDFYDWRSGVFSFPMDAERLQEESGNLLKFLGLNHSKHSKQSVTNYKQKLLEIQELIAEPYQSPEAKVDLLIQQGLFFSQGKHYELAVASYEEALAINSENSAAWYYRGMALYELGRYEEAISSYRKAIEIKDDYPEAWKELGNALYDLGKQKEALASYDKAIEIKPDYPEAILNKVIARFGLDRNKSQIFKFIYGELRLTKATEQNCQDVAKRIAEEVYRVGQAEEAMSIARQLLQECLKYYQLGASKGRVDLHSSLGANVYSYIHPLQANLSYKARVAMIEEFLQSFYMEAFKAFRHENHLPRNYRPQTRLELAEYMAFTQRYAQREMSLAGDKQQLLILRVQAFSRKQLPDQVDIYKLGNRGDDSLGDALL